MTQISGMNTKDNLEPGDHNMNMNTDIDWLLLTIGVSTDSPRFVAEEINQQTILPFLAEDSSQQVTQPDLPPLMSPQYRTPFGAECGPTYPAMQYSTDGTSGTVPLYQDLSHCVRQTDDCRKDVPLPDNPGPESPGQPQRPSSGSTCSTDPHHYYDSSSEDFSALDIGTFCWESGNEESVPINNTNCTQTLSSGCLQTEDASDTCNRRPHDNQAVNCRGRRPRVNDTQLSPNERARKERRREQNRRAAEKCRQKKKCQAENTLTEYQNLQCTNTNLQQQVRTLETEREDLQERLDSHLVVCQLKESRQHNIIGGATSICQAQHPPQ